MLNETETEETIVFYVTFLSLVAFQLGGAPPWLRLCVNVVKNDCLEKFWLARKLIVPNPD